MDRLEHLISRSQNPDLHKNPITLESLQNWQGQIDAALALFTDCQGKQVSCFRQYIERHRHRIINYAYYQAEQICSIGSSSVESSIKRIGSRLKLSGAQWKPHNVNSMLALRCAYLNACL